MPADLKRFLVANQLRIENSPVWVDPVKFQVTLVIPCRPSICVCVCRTLLLFVPAKKTTSFFTLKKHTQLINYSTNKQTRSKKNRIRVSWVSIWWYSFSSWELYGWTYKNYGMNYSSSCRMEHNERVNLSENLTWPRVRVSIKTDSFGFFCSTEKESYIHTRTHPLSPVHVD